MDKKGEYAKVIDECIKEGTIVPVNFGEFLMVDFN